MSLSALWHRLVNRDAVSLAWLHNQDRIDMTAGDDGICWRWPVKKLLDENPLWNAAKAKRKDAA